MGITTKKKEGSHGILKIAKGRQEGAYTTKREKIKDNRGMETTKKGRRNRS